VTAAPRVLDAVQSATRSTRSIQSPGQTTTSGTSSSSSASLAGSMDPLGPSRWCPNERAEERLDVPHVPVLRGASRATTTTHRARTRGGRRRMTGVRRRRQTFLPPRRITATTQARLSSKRLREGAGGSIPAQGVATSTFSRPRLEGSAARPAAAPSVTAGGAGHQATSSPHRMTDTSNKQSEAEAPRQPVHRLRRERGGLR
jgi:hypothetical protein